MGAAHLKGAPPHGTVLWALKDLDDPGTRSFDFGEGAQRFAMFIVRRGDDVQGFLNRCPHAGHPLDFPEHRFLTLDQSRLRCASHGAQFDLDGGKCVEGPCIGRSLVPVPVHVIDGMIYFGEKNGA